MHKMASCGAECVIGFLSHLRVVADPGVLQEGEAEEDVQLLVESGVQALHEQTDDLLHPRGTCAAIGTSTAIDQTKTAVKRFHGKAIIYMYSEGFCADVAHQDPEAQIARLLSYQQCVTEVRS